LGRDMGPKKLRVAYSDIPTSKLDWEKCCLCEDDTGYLQLPAQHTDSTKREVQDQFRSGNFVVRKTRNVFSVIAVDQAHELMTT